jgi:UTP--glucose-1-phosphate uridylyltransferase
VPVRKGVIPAAGLGTRFLPASKAVPKVLLPIVDRPVIQYAVEELARAGVTDICIVISRGQDAICDHFSAAPELEAALEATGKTGLLEEMEALNDLARIHYVRQHRPLGLGHAVWTARDHVGDEPFVVVLPDEVFDPRGGFLEGLIQTFDEHETSVITVQEVPADEIGLYGAIDPEDPSEDPLRVRSIVEKPAPGSAPSNLACVGRYVLEPQVFDLLSKLDPGAIGEIQLTDGLDVLAKEGQLLAQRYAGRRWDVGNKRGYLQAVFTLASEREDLGSTVAALVKGLRA